MVCFSCISFLGILFTLCGVIILYVKRCQQYWLSRGVTQLNPKLFIGNINFKESLDITCLEHYHKFKAMGLKFGGYYNFWKANLMILDPDLLKLIMVKDFDSFVNRGTGRLNDKDPLAGILPFLEDEQWKSMRLKLTPTFTSGKMRMMFHTFIECSQMFTRVLTSNATTKEPVNIKDALNKFTTEIIGSCAFGLECDTMKNPDSEFTRIIKVAFKPRAIKRYMTVVIGSIPLSFLRLLGIHLAPKEVEDFFVTLVNDMIEYREKNDVFRKDFLHMMIQLKNRGKVTDDNNEQLKDDKGATKSFLTMDEITAQCFVFFMAGFETSSTTMTFALYELAINSDVQEKLRKEINYVLKKHDNKLTYDSIADMTYLDYVIKETLRLHPPIGHLTRECNREYKLPNTDITIEKGTTISIPVLGIHMDEKYYPNPEKFDPNRFTEENNAKRPGCTWLPFGEGPRVCIGLRFGILQSKVGLITVIKDFKVTLNERTKLPLELDPGSTVATVRGGMWLNLEKVK